MDDMERIGLFPREPPAAPGGPRLAARRVRRADAGGGARGGASGSSTAVASRGAAVSARVFDRPRGGGARLAGARGGARRDGARPGRALTWEGWEDAAVAPEKLGVYLRDLRALLDRYGYGGDLYGHFGQGCVHTRIDFDLVDAPRASRSSARSSTRPPTSWSRYGGSLSGEHGDGQSRGGAAAEDVRGRARRGVPRVQGDLGSRRAR